jgi:hypothetical protein
MQPPTNEAVFIYTAARKDALPEKAEGSVEASG